MELPDGFVLSTVMAREDPRDALVSPHHASLDALPQGAVVGTSSLRRLVQLKARRPDLRIEPLRGNLDTRLRKLDEGQYDAIILAAAGLKRLGLAERIRQTLSIEDMLPSAGQGALGIEIRTHDHELAQLLAPLDHAPTRRATLAERAVSRALGGSCSMPLAAHAWWDDTGVMHLQARLGHPERPGLLLATVQGRPTSDLEADALGQAVARGLTDQGAAEWLLATC